MEKFKSIDDLTAGKTPTEFKKLFPELTPEEAKMAAIHFICTKRGVNTNMLECHKFCKMCKQGRK